MINNLDVRITPRSILATFCIPVADLRRTGDVVSFGKSEWQEWMHDWCICVEVSITGLSGPESEYPNHGTRFGRVISRPAAFRFAADNTDQVLFTTEGMTVEIEFLIPDCLHISNGSNWGSVAGGKIMVLGRCYHCQADLLLDPLYHTLELRKRKDGLQFIDNGSKVLTIPHQHSRIYHC